MSTRDMSWLKLECHASQIETAVAKQTYADLPIDRKAWTHGGEKSDWGPKRNFSPLTWS